VNHGEELRPRLDESPPGPSRCGRLRPHQPSTINKQHQHHIEQRAKSGLYVDLICCCRVSKVISQYSKSGEWPTYDRMSTRSQLRASGLSLLSIVISRSYLHHGRTADRRKSEEERRQKKSCIAKLKSWHCQDRTFPRPDFVRSMRVRPHCQQLLPHNRS
jgi:hypothetical protein